MTKATPSKIKQPEYNKLPLTSKQMDAIQWDDDAGFEYELVEEGDWNDQGKFSDRDIVFKNLEDGKFYRFYTYRHGNYYSGYDYEYYDNYATEVEMVEVPKIVTEWCPVVKKEEENNTND